MRLFKAARRIWRLATCTHRNACSALTFTDSTTLTFCTRCGRLLWFINDNDRRYNQHLICDQLDNERIVKPNVRRWMIGARKEAAAPQADPAAGGEAE